jgi:DUF438 domain-containing protein
MVGRGVQDGHGPCALHNVQHGRDRRSGARWVVYRAEYATEGKVVTVTYGTIAKKLTMRRDTDEPSSVARQLLIKIIAELHD